MGSSLVIRAKESGSILVTSFIISIGFMIVGSIFFAQKMFVHYKKGEAYKLPWKNSNDTINYRILLILLYGGFIEFGGSIILSSSFYYARKAHLNQGITGAMVSFNTIFVLIGSAILYKEKINAP